MMDTTSPITPQEWLAIAQYGTLVPDAWHVDGKP